MQIVIASFLELLHFSFFGCCSISGLVLTSISSTGGYPTQSGSCWRSRNRGCLMFVMSQQAFCGFGNFGNFGSFGMADLLKLISHLVSRYHLANKVLRKVLPQIPFKSSPLWQVGWPIGHSIVDTELRGNRATISTRVPEQPSRIAPQAERLDIWQHCETEKETATYLRSYRH